MLCQIRKHVKKYTDGVFASRPAFQACPFDLDKTPQGHFKSFGPRHPDKTFYVIWCANMGSGFFSNVSHVLSHMKLAVDLGIIPVVDFKNFKTLYNEKAAINETENAWEYYFNPVSPYTLEEVYESKNVFFCSGSYPSLMRFSVSQVPGLYQDVFSKFVSPNDEVTRILKERQSAPMDRVLGVHFRGQEQKLAAGHSFPPTEKQMIKYTDQILQEYDVDRIFVVTEEQSYLDLYVKRYGNKVLYNDSYRTYRVNSYNIQPRDDHRYKLGLEVLVDSLMLSKCRGLLCGDSNVSEFARFANNNRYEFVYKIYNGVNSERPLVARHLYGVKKLLPPRLGGLADRVTITRSRE